MHVYVYLQKGVNNRCHVYCMMVTPEEGCIICMETSTSYLIDIPSVERTCICNYSVHSDCMHNWLEKTDNCLICHSKMTIVKPLDYWKYILYHVYIFFGFVIWLTLMILMVYYGGNTIR